MTIGACYYPEHWPRQRWQEDAHKMVALGISQVRLAEFAWSEIEPSPQQWRWQWLDEAIACLAAVGLKIVLCTPTATPPKWMVDAHPDILAVDATGRRRTFGSRRHYCFSSQRYRDESQRITTAIAQRYGEHPAVVAWQTDNEYGCHNTVLSYSPEALQAFRRWCQERYGDIAALNQAWGTVFWSQTYRHFDEIDAPIGTVTEANPANLLDYRRFSSDQVVAFNREQVALLRRYSPGRDVLHNFMGFFTEFDHRRLAQDLDVVTWDSYPLGFTQNFDWFSQEEKETWLRSGHPDVPAFHHDLYRGMKPSGRWYVMEQQPGPVNWAAYNPAPAQGVVRLWTWQAWAHGAEVVNYFRWRQFPQAQEQMHAGLLRPDSSLAEGGLEAQQAESERKALSATGLKLQRPRAKVALVFDYESVWMTEIQPQGAGYSALEISFQAYSALRALGLEVDIVGSECDLSPYALLVLPAQLQASDSLKEKLKASPALKVLGPRFGSKTEHFSIDPQSLTDLTGIQVLRVESLPPHFTEQVVGMFLSPAKPANPEILEWNPVCTMLAIFSRWREHFSIPTEAATTPLVHYRDGAAAVVASAGYWVLAGLPHRPDDWLRLLGAAAHKVGLTPQILPLGIRLQRSGNALLVTNFSNKTATFQPVHRATCVLGDACLPPFGLALWQLDS